MKKFTQQLGFILLVAALLGLGCASCRNTVRGVGQDMEHAGEHVERSAR